MTTTHTQNSASGVPNFLVDEEDDSISQIMPGAVRQPENSAEPESKTTESKPIGAVSDSESAIIGADAQIEAVEFNPIVAGDQNEFDDETNAEPIPEARPAPTGKEWKKRVAAGEVNGWEHPNRGKSDDSPTKKKRKEGSTYRRKRLGEKDFTVLAVLLLHEFLTTKMVGIIRGISFPSARRLMLGLQELGVVGQEKFDYGPQLWYLTGKGLTYLESVMDIPDTARPLHRKGHFDHTKIRPNLLAAHVTAQLLAGKDTIRQFIDIPLSTGLDLIPHLIPESFVRSEFTKALQNKGYTGGFESGHERGKAIQNLWLDIQRDKRDGQSGQSLIKENPALWMVVGRKIDADAKETNYFHPADLIISLLSAEEYCVYVEIELSIKSEDKLRRILMTYFQHQSPSAVGSVVYLTNQKSIAERVIEIAQECYDKIERQETIPKKERKIQQLVRVALLKDADGNKFSGNVWDL